MNVDGADSLNEWAPFCRACLVTSNLKSVLDNDGLRTKFKEITSIEINEEDVLISLLCENCIDVLTSAHHFRKQCIKIDNQIKKQLMKINEDISLENKCDDISNMSFEKNSQSDELLNEDIEDDELYVIVVNDDDKLINENDSLANIFDNESESSLNNKYLMPEQIKVESFDEIEKDDVNVSVDVETSKSDKPDFIKLEYNFANNGLNSIHNDNINVIQLFKDNTVDCNIVKLENPLTSNTLSNEISTEDNVTYTQEEIVVSNGEDTYEIINCDISELNMENLEQIDQKAIWQQNDGSFLCECGKIYTDLSEFEKHIATHNNHTCHICNRNMESKEVLKGHILLHECDNTVLSCPYCLKSIKRNMLSTHITANHTQQRPTCTVCKKTFATEHNRKRHMAIHFDFKHYECDICHSRFSQKRTLDNHKLLHENLGYLNCNSCLTVYSPEEAHLHETCGTSIFEEDPSESKKLSCNKCENTFDNLLSLRNHVELAHPQQSNLLCPACGLVFPNKKALYGHFCPNRHNKPKNTKRFCCKDCGKGSASQAMLAMHERVHTNERPFKCKNCILAFKTKTHLNTHQLTHTQEKKFACSSCPKAFSLKGNLVVHIRTHTGERPYVCHICNQAFIDSKYLKKHKLRRHTVEESMW